MAAHTLLVGSTYFSLVSILQDSLIFLDDHLDITSTHGEGSYYCEVLDEEFDEEAELPGLDNLQPLNFTEDEDDKKVDDDEVVEGDDQESAANEDVNNAEVAAEEDNSPGNESVSRSVLLTYYFRN